MQVCNFQHYKAHLLLRSEGEVGEAGCHVGEGLLECRHDMRLKWLAGYASWYGTRLFNIKTDVYIC